MQEIILYFAENHNINHIHLLMIFAIYKNKDHITLLYE